MLKGKQLAAMAAAAMMICAAIPGCSAAPADSKGESQAAQSSTTESKAEESKAQEGEPQAGDQVFELFIPSQNMEKLNDNQKIKQIIEEKAGIKMTMIPFLEKEALNLQMASGDVPEFFWGITMSDYHKYADQGLIMELPVDTIKKNAPKLSEWAEKSAGGEQVWSYYDHNGKNYSIPELWTLATDGRVVGYRESILKECGIEKAPETIAELETALKAMKDKKGIAGITSENGVGGLSFIYGAFGDYLTYYEKDGEVVFGGIEQGAKDAVTLLNKWYADGYIDPEFSINKFDNVKEKWGNDQAAVVETFWWEFLPKEAFFDGRLYEVNAGKDQACSVAMPPKGESGQQGITQGNPVVGGGAAFGSQMASQQDKVAKYLQFFDLSIDRELMDLAYYGIEGETYNYDDQTGVEWIAPYDTEEKRDEFGIALYRFPGCFNDYDLQAKYMTQPKYLELRQNTQKNGLGKYSIFDPFYRPVYNEKTEVLDKIYKNAHIDFITGTRPISEWDAFVAEWTQAGGEAVIKEAQDILDNME